MVYRCKTCRRESLRSISYLVQSLDIMQPIIHMLQLLYVVFGILVVVRCCSVAFQCVVNAGTVVMREIKTRRQFPGNVKRVFAFSLTQPSRHHLPQSIQSTEISIQAPNRTSTLWLNSSVPPANPHGFAFHPSSSQHP